MKGSNIVYIVGSERAPSGRALHCSPRGYARNLRRSCFDTLLLGYPSLRAAVAIPHAPLQRPLTITLSVLLACCLRRAAQTAPALYVGYH